MPENSRQPVIVGAFNTRQARVLEGETSHRVTLAAIKGALADAGLERSEVDGLNILPGLDYQNGTRAFGYALDIPYFWVGRQAPGPASVLEAAAAIREGVCDVVVLAAGEAGIHTDRTSVAPWTRPSNEFIECWGLMTPAEFALSAQEYLHRFAVDPVKIAYVASVIRNNGARNPEAIYYGRGPFTPQDILDSRLIAEPYHLLDCAMTGEGGSALVLTTAERARDLPAQAVTVLGGGSESWGPSYTHPPTYDRVGMLGRRAADRAFAQAGLARADVDVFELYDNFSWEIIRYFEAFGYCAVGEGADFVADGTIEIGGTHPIVTDGGTMAHSHTGESQRHQRVVQAVRQLRGTTSANQVEGARTALVAALGDVILLGA
ncbi:thiolase family protein [Nocardioides sp. QY071]|uniref:thiolase family protein n=1 Tax=Nocardioides sp. QY071 TaxID=3044187 RepID=UPI00249CAC1C|nr:thiolase family protein [Nocardioides sp. QY071]WGY00374.1 thiolase family protein [Nocardioides sp. QY071]